MAEVNPPKIEVKSDYDGFFEHLVQTWIQHKSQQPVLFKHKTIEVSAGPYRSYAVSFEEDGETLKLDFYSALRTGFGQLLPADIAAIVEML